MKPMDLTEIIKYLELKVMYHRQVENRAIARELNEILFLLDCYTEGWESEENETK